MSNESKEQALPTAAYEWRYEDWEKGHTTLRHDKPENNFDVELSLEHELVRRKDVEKLIIRVQNEYSKYQDWEDNSEKQAIVDSLIEELLEEVQSE